MDIEGISSTITTSLTSSGDPELFRNETASSNETFCWIGWIPSVGLVVGFGRDDKSTTIGILEEDI